WMERSL
ncbi:hypothetical protein Hypma_006060, partial [Hypsizygus marmoreus]